MKNPSENWGKLAYSPPLTEHEENKVLSKKSKSK